MIQFLYDILHRGDVVTPLVGSRLRNGDRFIFHVFLLEHIDDALQANIRVAFHQALHKIMHIRVSTVHWAFRP